MVRGRFVALVSIVLLVSVSLLLSGSGSGLVFGAVDRVEDGGLAVLELWSSGPDPFGVSRYVVVPVEALAAAGVAPRGRFVIPSSLYGLVEGLAAAGLPVDPASVPTEVLPPVAVESANQAAVDLVAALVRSGVPASALRSAGVDRAFQSFVAAVAASALAARSDLG